MSRGEKADQGAKEVVEFKQGEQGKESAHGVWGRSQFEAG